MKKLNILILLLALTTCNAIIKGQANQGKVIIKGSTSFSLTSMSSKIEGDMLGTQEEESTTTLIFNPGIGYFVIDNFAISLEINYEYMSSKSPGLGSSHASEILAGPFIYYYFGQSNIKPYIGAGVLLGSYKSGSSTSSDIFGYGAGAGLAIYVRESVAFDFSLNYQSQTAKPSGSNPYNEKYISSGVVFSAGFSIEL